MFPIEVIRPNPQREPDEKAFCCVELIEGFLEPFLGLNSYDMIYAGGWARSVMAATFSDNTPGLVAILNNRPDFERAREQHWYSIPVPTAPDDILKFRWVAFYLTQAFEHEKWSIRYWTEIKKITRHRSEKRCQEPFVTECFGGGALVTTV